MTRHAALVPARIGPTSCTLMIALTAVCFGLVPLFARELQEVGVGSSAIALYRFVFSAVLLLPFLPVAPEKRGEALLMLGAGLAMGLGWITYLEAVKVASVSAAGVIYMSYPLFTIGFAWLLVGQRPTIKSFLSGALVLAAASLALGAGASGAMTAETAIALLWSVPAPIAFAFIVVVMSARSRGLGTLERMACGMLGASAGLMPLALIQGGGALLPAAPGGWIPIAGLALLTAFLPQLVYTYAAARVAPTRLAAAGSVELPTMFAIGWLAFGEPFGTREALAAVLVLAAVLITPSIRPSPE